MIEVKSKPCTETEKLFSDLNKPSLHTLSYSLRHPDTWPAGFMWDFNDCGQCAMGLAHALWFAGQPKPGEEIYGEEDEDIEANNTAWVSTTARNFAMPYGEAKRIFVSNEWTAQRRFLITRLVPFEAITPEMVADQIDKYLATAE